MLAVNLSPVVCHWDSRCRVFQSSRDELTAFWRNWAELAQKEKPRYPTRRWDAGELTLDFELQAAPKP